MSCPFRSLRPAWGFLPIIAASCLGLGGCKSDLSQQLLERELRYQEDQIYQLQDELQEKCARVDTLSGENASLRKQLGVSDGDTLMRSRTGIPRPTPAAVNVPPAIQIPEAIRSPSPATMPLAPPALDNIPPLPVKPSATSEPTPLALPAPADAAATPPARPAATGPASGSLTPAVPVPFPVAVPASYGEPVSDGRPVRLVINAATTACFDDNGDGRSDGLAVTFEPRDADEKLVPAPGVVTVTVFDTADPAAPLDSWTIPPEQAATHFRPTTRLRGVHLPLRWAGPPPPGDHVRVIVRVTGPEGAVLETDATIGTK